jgi:hypothetical protein
MYDCMTTTIFGRMPDMVMQYLRWAALHCNVVVCLHMLHATCVCVSDPDPDPDCVSERLLQQSTCLSARCLLSATVPLCFAPGCARMPRMPGYRCLIYTQMLARWKDRIPDVQQSSIQGAKLKHLQTLLTHIHPDN